MRLDTERSVIEVESVDISSGAGELFHALLEEFGEEVEFNRVQDPTVSLGKEGKRAVFDLDGGVLIIEGGQVDGVERMRVWRAGQEGQVQAGIPGQSCYLDIRLPDVGESAQLLLMEERGWGRRPRIVGTGAEAEQWILNCLDGQG